MATTIKDVAKIAGVSFKTVSRVLNNETAVGDVTRQRVLDAIAHLDYQPHQSARQMRTRKSQTIGFITDEIAITPFAGNIIKGAQHEAWQHNKLLLVVNTEGQEEIEQGAINMMRERRVDGVIYAAMFHREVSLPESFLKIPTVLADCYTTDPHYPSVVPDEFQGGYLATETLAEHGHKRIGFINVSPTEHAQAAKGRLAGYQQALKDHNIMCDEELIRYGNARADQGYQKTIELMNLSNPPTALFCATDRTAMGAYNALQSLGLRIPNDVAVIGFDNQELISAYLQPPLTTIALPHYEMGRWAVKSLLEGYKVHLDVAASRHKLPCPLVQRESV